MDNICNYKNKKGIYKLSINCHIYIGSSVDLAKRIRRHFADLRRQDHDNSYLQRVVNKYGIKLLSWEIVEIVDTSYTSEQLLILEKHYIEWYNADLNLKKDPTTQQNCVTTSKPIYQFNSFGELIKKWPSISEAARFYNVDASNITVCIKNKQRQKFCAGFLWDETEIYSGSIEILYVFDLNGNYLNKFSNTVDIYLTYFPNLKRKSVLSQIRKKINSKIPYKNIYISTDQKFKPDLNYKPRYHDETELEKKLKTNPIIYVFNKNGNLIYSKNFKDFRSPNYIKKALQSKLKYRYVYSLTDNVDSWIYVNYNSVSIISTNVNTNEVLKFRTIKECAIKLFGDPMHDKHIVKHMQRNTPYKNYIFKRDI